MPPQHGGGGTGAAPVPDSYFTESRKGEINELRNLLRGFAAERDPQRKRDIIKKVRRVPSVEQCVLGVSTIVHSRSRDSSFGFISCYETQTRSSRTTP
jgi:hypothetical protein